MYKINIECSCIAKWLMGRGGGGFTILGRAPPPEAWIRVPKQLFAMQPMWIMSVDP